jgi:RNA polymerase sigma factor (sigma-70 family)
MIRSRVSNPEEQEDIYQNLYLALVSNPVPPSVTDPLPYLSRIIRNDVIDAARRRKSFRDMAGRYVLDSTRAAQDRNPEKEVIRAEDMQRVAACLASLSPQEAKALAARYGRACNTADAARALQVKQRTFSRYLCVALKKLRRAAAGLEIEQDTPHRPSLET